jgi:hypothetical protein
MLKHGNITMREVAPTSDERLLGSVVHSDHLDKFDDLGLDGRSLLAEKLQALRVDTLVMTGAWTESCVLATALDAVDQQHFEVVIVKDAVGASTPSHFAALEVLSSLGALLITSGDLVSYLRRHSGDDEFILVSHMPDGVEVNFGPSDQRHPKAVYLSIYAFAGAMGAVAAASAAVGAVFAVCSVRRRLARGRPYLLLDP